MFGEAGGGGKMAATIIESFFQRSLEDLVKGLRVQVIGEAVFFSKALNEVRKEIKSTDVTTKAVALQKLTYLNMLQGTNMSWAAFHVVEVMSMQKFSIKKLGYLAASQSFNESTDVLLLITNLLRKDFGGNNDHVASLAVECLSRVATTDLARDLLPDLFTILAGSRALVKKKATVALSRVFNKYPDAIRVALKRLIERLSDGDPSIVTAAIGVLCDLAMKGPKSLLPLAPELYNLLVQNPNTWLCIKLVKMFGVMVPLEPRLGKKIADPICELMRTSQATSLLLECIQTVTSGLMEQQGAVKLCVEKLTALLQEDDTNVKYLCLRALLNLMPVHPWAVAANNEAIANCLTHRDPSIHKGARRLIIGMVSEDNVIPTVRVLLQCAFKADAESCDELVSSILSTCSSDYYHLISDYSWYVSSLSEMARIPHCNCGDEIGRQLVDIGFRVKSATSDILRAGRDLLLDVTLLDRAAVQGVLKAAAWIVGEYVSCYVNHYELVEGLLQPRTRSLPASVRALYVQAVLKVLVYSWSMHFGKKVPVNAGITDSSKVSVDQDISEAEFCSKQSPSMLEPEDFPAVQPGDPSTKGPGCGCESQFMEELEVCSRYVANLEQIQTNGDSLQAPHDRQDKSAVRLGEERGRTAQSQVKEKGTTVREQQSLLGFLEPTFEMIGSHIAALATSSDVEMQERACNLLGLLQVVKDISSVPFPDGKHFPGVQLFDELLSALLGVLTVEFGPVSVHAQGRVTAREGLLLDNLDVLGPSSNQEEDREAVIERGALPDWEGRNFFSFQSSNPSALGESAVLLAQHRQRHENFYLRSEGQSANNSFGYPPPIESYLDPEQLTRTQSTGSISLGQSTKSIRLKAKPVVVKLDDEDDRLNSSFKLKQRDVKDDFISSAITDLLSGGSRRAQKHRAAGQHSGRSSRYSDREKSSYSRVKDGSALGREVSPALVEDEKISNVGAEPGIMHPLSKHRHFSNEKEKRGSRSAAGYEPQATKSLRSPKGKTRPRRSGGHKGTSFLKKLSDNGLSPESNLDFKD